MPRQGVVKHIKKAAASMSAPRFTVYLPSCNKGKYLVEAVESMLRQSAGDWELLLIDVGSTDATAEVMRRYQGDERIRTFSLEKRPLPTVCNFALSQARGAYFMRLDGDDILEENILLVQGNYLDSHREAALVFSDYYFINEVGDVLSLEVRDRVYHGDHLMDRPPNGACTMIRTDMLRRLGGYREDLGAQDGLDLWCKIRKAGFLSGNVTLPLFYYRLHGTNLTNDAAHILLSQRGILSLYGAQAIDAYRPLLAAIPCRRNYDFTPDLWREELGGQSLLAGKVRVCLQAAIFDKVVVYCDNPAAAQELAGFDDPRLELMHRDTACTIRSVNLAMALRPLVARHDPEFRGTTVVNYIQTPFITRQTLEDACFSLAAHEADSSLGVEALDVPLYRRTARGLSPLRNDALVRTSQENYYRETRSCMATRNRNIRDGSLTGPRVTSFVMAREEPFFIDSPRTLEIARMLVERDA
jgi:CMP-N-acetylneuraminic acid synthetase